MKSIIEYNNPQNLNDRSNCILMVCVDMPDMNQTYAFTHPTIEIHSSLPSSPTSCYVEYLRFIIDNYWNLRSKERMSNQNIGLGLPKLFIPGKSFDRVFGGNAVDIRPQGSAELIFGLKIEV